MHAPSPRAGRRGHAALLCAIFLSSLSPLVRAEPSAAQIKTARQLFAEAEELRSRGDCRAAAEKLRLAIEIKETPGLRFHLAHCEERLGQLVLADADYRKASELIRSGAQAPDVERLLSPARRSLAERVPTIRVRVPVPDARVRLDGQDIPPDTAKGFILVDPGKHSLTVDAEGYDPFQIELSVAEGEDRVIDAKLRAHGVSSEAPPAPMVAGDVASADAAPPDPRREPSRFGTREIVVIGESALALAGAGVGVVFLLKHQAADEDAKSAALALPDQYSCHQSTAAACGHLQDALLDRAHAGNMAIGGFVGAGVFGAAAVATWFLWPSSPKAHATVSVAPLPGGAMVRGAF